MKWVEREVLEEMVKNTKKFLENREVKKAKKQLEEMLEEEEHIPKKKIRDLVEKYQTEEASGDLVTELKMLSKEEPEWDSWTEG